MPKLHIPPRILNGLRSRTARFRWSTEYAGFVHEERAFTRVGVEAFNIPAAVAKGFSDSHDLAGSFDGAMVELGDRFTEVIDRHDWGIDGKGMKKFRNGRTMRTISDSRKLAESQSLVLGD